MKNDNVCLSYGFGFKVYGYNLNNINICYIG